MSKRLDEYTGEYFHEDALLTERIIRSYLLRTLDEETAELFESHYLMCDRCFDDLRAAELLILGLDRTAVRLRTVGDVAVLGFAPEGALIRRSAELAELSRMIIDRRETKVVIDLSSVRRIDSAGLGVLMECYSHVVAQRGALKVLKPSPDVQHALRVTKLDKLIESYADEDEALRAFRPA